MLSRKLTCTQVQEIVEAFFDGTPVIELAEEFGVGRATIANILYRASYRDCFDPTELFGSTDTYLSQVKIMMNNNKRRSKGRGRVKSA